MIRGQGYDSKWDFISNTKYNWFPKDNENENWYYNKRLMGYLFIGYIILG
jgi:hypothetical protein